MPHGRAGTFEANRRLTNAKEAAINVTDQFLQMLREGGPTERSAAEMIDRYQTEEQESDRQIQNLLAENERLRLGLKMIADMDYDAGYTAEDFAAEVLKGDEPQKS